MGYKGLGGLAKEKWGPTVPPSVWKRPKGLGLGVGPNAATTIEKDLQYTFTPQP